MFPSSAMADLTWLSECACMAIYWCCMITTVFIFVVGVYRLTLHPLAGIPGPRLAAVSNIWYARRIASGRLARLGVELHAKYGDVVRVGPNEVWFNTREAFDQIYAVGKGFEKSDFYLATALTRPSVNWRLEAHFPDSLDLLSERDMKRYRLQRRAIGRVYSMANVLNHEAAIDAAIKLATQKLASLKGEELDLREWMHIIAVECLGASVLSWSPGLLRDGQDGGTLMHSFKGWRRRSLFGVFPGMKKLEQWSPGLGRMFASLWGVVHKPPGDFRPFFPAIGRIVGRRMKAFLGPTTQKVRRPDLLDDLMKLHQEKPEFNEVYLRRMAVTNFGAGHETLASTLTSAVAMIASHGVVQRRVSKEIKELHSALAYESGAKLPYTKAAIRESMRLYPVVAISFPRRVPATGMHVHGLSLPADTTVGCNPNALHRNQDIYGPSPEEYNPSRWLDGDPSAKNELSAKGIMAKYNLSWGGGPRTCPGRNLGELIVFKVIVALFDAFDVEVLIPPDADREAYFLFMLSDVKTRFHPREKSRQD